jgi:death-on-curing protein
LPSEPVWLGAALLTEINRELVELTGEPFLVRDQGLLESALARPANHWAYGEEDLAVLAATLLIGVARNHPFAQGNKRTAFAAAEAFLHANGWRLTAPDSAALADRVVDLITGELSEAEFADLLREHSVPI